MNKIPDTAISGALTGGMLNAWKRGRAGIAPGVTTAALICTFLQLVYNELGIMRIKYVSNKLQSSGDMVPAQTLPPTTPAPPRVRIDHEPPRPMMERILTALGFHQIPDQEFLAMMKRKRDGYLQRIAELEKDIEEQKQKGEEPPKSGDSDKAHS